MKKIRKIKIVTTKIFNKSIKKCSLKIKKQTKRRINLYLYNPRVPILKLHKLKGKLSDTYSINITGDYRLWFGLEETDTVTVLTLKNIGTHSQLY